MILEVSELFDVHPFPHEIRLLSAVIVVIRPLSQSRRNQIQRNLDQWDHERVEA